MDLRIPKHAVVVELRLEGREARKVELYLAEHRDRSWRRQDVLDLLEHPPEFLPARDVADQARVLFNKATVVWIGVPRAAQAADEAPGGAAPDPEPLYEQKRAVRLELLGGVALDGKLLYSAPPERARVSDHLNGPGRFLRLHTDEQLYLVNKAFVVRALDREARRTHEDE